MPAEYENLRNCFRNKFSECKIRVMYGAGFRGFELHDQLIADGWECVVTPLHTLTEEKSNQKKNGRNDSRRSAKNNENDDYRICHVLNRQLREERRFPRLYGRLRRDINRMRTAMGVIAFRKVSAPYL
jgi:hypothetical protein